MAVEKTGGSAQRRQHIACNVETIETLAAIRRLQDRGARQLPLGRRAQ